MPRRQAGCQGFIQGSVRGKWKNKEKMKNKEVKKQNIPLEIPSVLMSEPFKCKYWKRFPRNIFQKCKKHRFSCYLSR